MAAPQRRQQQQQPQQQQQQQQQQQPRQQVTINAALDTLCNMFESVDRDVIHMILIEGCGGNMESAVEALLTMTGGISQKQSKQKQESQPKPPPAPQQQQQQQSQSQSQAVSSINLPDDFLRPPSYFLSKYENSVEYNFENASKRQIIEDELFAKAIFEDSLFSADLHANPEWVLEELNNNNNNNNDKQQQNNNKKKKKNKKKYSWRGQYNSQFEDEDNEHRQIDLDNVDPSDLNARKISFKQRFNSLGVSAKQKLGNLAHKLQRNKQESKQQNKFESLHQYKNILTSLDDETLIDQDDNNINNAIIEIASEDNRGTYQAPIVPNKPSQKL